MEGDPEGDAQGGARTDAGAHASEGLARNRLVELEGVTPESFIAKCVEPEDSPSIDERLNEFFEGKQNGGRNKMGPGERLKQVIELGRGDVLVITEEIVMGPP